MTLPSQENKEQFVYKLFSQLANNYDLMNNLMTGGLHILWKREACELALKNNSNEILDLACGTGDMSFALNKISPEANIIGLDFCQEMLDIAIDKNTSEKIKFIQGNALELNLPDNSFDSVIISYGLRNMSDYKKCLEEIYRVLKPTGKLVILDMSHPNKLMNILSWPHRHIVIPVLGRIFAQDSDSYKYLVNSINIYLNQEELKDLLVNLGFREVNYKNFMGGVSALHTGVK